MMAAGKNRRDNGVSTGAAAAGTSLSSRNSLSSQPTVPVLSKTAATPNSAAPRLARSPAVRAVGTRAGRSGHHHDSSDFIEPNPDRACSGRPRWLTADAVRKPAATIGLKLAFDIARGLACCAECRRYVLGRGLAGGEGGQELVADVGGGDAGDLGVVVGGRDLHDVGADQVERGERAQRGQ